MGDTRKDTGDIGSGDPEDTGMGGPRGHTGDVGDRGTKVTQGLGIQRTQG